MKKTLKVVDLFSGCGGLSLGFRDAGYEVVAAVDNWVPAIQTHRNNFSHPILDIDLTDVEEASSTIRKFNPDMIVGGPPCQDFSHAGKRDESLGRANLTVSFANIVANVKPRWFLMENVGRITKSKALKTAKEIIKKNGYGITERILDASLCGAPQKRKRFFMFGELGGKDGSLDSFLTNNLSQKPMTVREYFGRKIKTEHYYRHPRNYSRRAIYSIDEPSATIRGVNRPIPKGYKGHPLDSTKDLKKVRPLTTMERAQIQTFPENFAFSGSKTEIEQLIGNAVPVKLAQYVGERIQEYVLSRNKNIRRVVIKEKAFKPYASLV